MSKSRFSGVEHDHWVKKQQSTARAERQTGDRTYKKEEDVKQTCYNCGKTLHCRIFIAMRSKDVYSAGGSEGCDCKSWEPRKKQKGKSDKEINSLLNQFKKLRN